MTVQQLIRELSKLEDKNREIVMCDYNNENAYISIDAVEPCLVARIEGVKDEGYMIR